MSCAYLTAPRNHTSMHILSPSHPVGKSRQRLRTHVLISPSSKLTQYNTVSIVRGRTIESEREELTASVLNALVVLVVRTVEYPTVIRGVQCCVQLVDSAFPVPHRDRDGFARMQWTNNERIPCSKMYPVVIGSHQGVISMLYIVTEFAPAAHWLVFHQPQNDMSCPKSVFDSCTQPDRGS